jgi:DNA-directed RNA polymerase-4/5 subunit 2
MAGFIAREQICLKRLGISNTQCCRTPSYKSEVKRKRSSVRLVELLKLESIKGEKKGLCVYFLSTEIPVYTLLLALGVRSDSRDASIVTIFVMLMRNVSIF